MSETISSSQGQTPKTCNLATISLVLGVVGLGIAAAVIPPGGCAFFVPLPIAGLVLAVAALYRIRSKKEHLRGSGSAIVGLVINSALVFLAFSISYKDMVTRELAYRVVCGTHLRELGKRLRIHANDTGRGDYPAVDEWCDALLRYNQLEEKEPLDKRWFICRGAARAGDTGPCHYAINPNCGPNSPGDVVLSFETKGGWNQHGGPEILTTENHGGKGCNVLFNDGSVRFVKTEELGELEWSEKENAR